MGIAHVFESGKGVSESVQPRIIVQEPQRGFFHPASKSDILEVLGAVGPEVTYCLTTISLSRAPQATRNGLPPLGRLSVPGNIIIFEQPIPPWRLSGTVYGKDLMRLSRAGAIVEYHNAADATLVDWTAESLRDFILFEVLLHEVGHHILQHYKGRRAARIARTRDHETFAQNFADRCRAVWFGGASRE